MTRLQFRSSLLAVIAVLSACNPSVTGLWTAQETGTLIEPPAERGSPTEPLIERCHEQRDPPVRRPDHVRRGPYLQLAETDSVRLQWTTRSDASMGVDIIRPDGSEARHVESTLEETKWLEPAVQHVADVGGLEPGSVYCYRLRDAGGRVSAYRGFRTAPAPGPGGNVAFVALGDFGSGKSDQREVRDRMKNVPWDLMVTTGDNAYNSGTLQNFEEKFFPIYDDMLRSLPVFPSTGNHDYGTDAASPFREVFSLPTNGGPEGHERWYSFDWGNVHFVALDTELVGPAQIEWLEDDLAGTDLPWTIVYMHRPPFSSGSSHGSSKRVRSELVPVFERHGVPLVLTGHSHHYERSKPMNGVNYVVTGGGGEGVRPVGTSEWTAFSASVAHFVYVTVDDGMLRLHAIDASGQEFDGLEITL